MASDLSQHHYQIILITYLKDFIVVSVQIINLISITLNDKKIKRLKIN